LAKFLFKICQKLTDESSSQHNGSSPADGSSKTRMPGFMESTVAMVMHFFPPALRKEELGIYRLSHN
jgi:hypothetical protein